MADGPDQYLSQSKMTHTKTWGSDVEILAAAHLLNTKIFVYTKHGPTWQWVEHDLELTSPNTRTHRHAIYLKHTQLVHYDVVVSVKKIPLTGPQKYKTSALRRAKLRRRCTRARGRGRFYYKRKCKTATSRRFMKRKRKRSYRLKS
ncbi:ATP-dependent DNA helicase [Biomphalaria glabrata]